MKEIHVVATEVRRLNQFYNVGELKQPFFDQDVATSVAPETHLDDAGFDHLDLPRYIIKNWDCRDDSVHGGVLTSPALS